MKQISIKIAEDQKGELLENKLKRFAGKTYAEKLEMALEMAMRYHEKRKENERLKAENEQLAAQLAVLSKTVKTLQTQYEEARNGANTVDFDMEKTEVEMQNSTHKEEKNEGSSKVPEGSHDQKEGTLPPDDPENWLPERIGGIRTGTLAGIMGVLLVAALWLFSPSMSEKEAVIQENTNKKQFVNVDSIALATLKRVQALTQTIE